MVRNKFNDFIVLDPAGIRIHIEQILCIRIRIGSIRIHITGLYLILYWATSWTKSSFFLIDSSDASNWEKNPNNL